MALFKAQKNTKKEKKADTPSESIVREMGSLHASTPSSYANIIRNPRITEKATMKSEGGVYTFDIPKTATKNDVKAAVRLLFKVSPTKVTIVMVRGKKVIARGKKGRTAGGKKAYVYLKEGDKIEFV